MIRTVCRKSFGWQARCSFPHIRVQHISTANASTGSLRKYLKYAALTTVVVGGSFVTAILSISHHLSSVFYVREFLSEEEVKQYHDLEENLVGDEFTLLDNRRAKYVKILARYRQYMEPFQIAREPGFTVGYIEQLNEYIVEKTVDYATAMILGDSETRLSAFLAFLTVMLTNQEIEVIRKKYKHIPIWLEDEEGEEGSEHF